MSRPKTMAVKKKSPGPKAPPAPLVARANHITGVPPLGTPRKKKSISEKGKSQSAADVWKELSEKQIGSDEELYARCTQYRLLKKREVKEPTPSDARLAEHHFNDWRLLNTTTSQILYNLALGGDENAARLLFTFAFRSTELLRNLAFENPAALHPISEYQIIWPTFWSKKEYLKEENEKMIQALKLGEKSRMTGNFNLKTRATQAALNLLSWLHQNRELLELPLLTETTREKWFQAGWKRHDYETEGNPAADLYLRTSVEEAAKREVHRKQEKANLDSVIARRIKSAVKQGFESVTAQAS